MIWIDFTVICIGQSEISIPNDIPDVRFDAYRRTTDSEPIYHESYHFQTADNLLGNLYFVWLPEEICYDQSFFDIDRKGSPWVYVDTKWENTVKSVLQFYLQESPIHQIAVLLRTQDESADISHPICSLEAYMNALTEGNIRWNELYFIEG